MRTRKHFNFFLYTLLQRIFAYSTVKLRWDIEPIIIRGRVFSTTQIVNYSTKVTELFILNCSIVKNTIENVYAIVNKSIDFSDCF